MSAAASHLETRRAVARKVAASLNQLPDVIAVYVFGSVASGYVDERSDVDISVVCKTAIPSPQSRIAVLEQLGAGWKSNDPAHSNPIWQGTDTSGVVDGIQVEVHYQLASAVSGVLNEVISTGALTTEKVPFRPYTVASLVQTAWALSDSEGIFGEWRRLLSAYPEPLKRSILTHFAPLLEEYTSDMIDIAERQLGPGAFIFTLVRAADAMKRILLAINEVYDPADKREDLTVIPFLSRLPQDYAARYRYIIEGPFDDAGALKRARLFQQLAAEVMRMLPAR